MFCNNTNRIHSHISNHFRRERAVRFIFCFVLSYFCHVYREHNTRADTLSKEGLCLAPGHLLLTESYEEEFIREDSLQIF